MLKGQCLCTSVQFQFSRNIHTVYQCHCSLCRKQSGTHANHATMVHKEHFAWMTEHSAIGTYKKETGFTSCFCIHCGSPVPNQIGQSSYMWIPLGLLDQDIHPQKRLNFCLNSRANWELNPENSALNENYPDLPSWKELEQFFWLI